MSTLSCTLRARISAPPVAVYAALTDACALRTWLAEEAESAPEAGTYRFWGRYTPDGGARGSQRLLSYAPGRGLRFSWVLRSALTEVDIVLTSADDAGTLLTLTQSGVPEAAGAHGYSVRDFWRLSLDNLASYCEGRGLAPKCDFTDFTDGAAAAGVDIEAEPAKVFAALTDPDQLNRWIAVKADVEPRTGGRYEFGWEGEGPVKILDLEPDRVLEYSWRDSQLPPTAVRWELAGSGGRTHLTIVHSGFAADQPTDGYQLGWQAFLGSLKRMLEIGPSWTPDA